MADFGRLVFQFDGRVAAGARVSGSVLVISFDQPVDVSAERLPNELAAYFAVARRDPDGKALRFALKRAVKTNVMEAGDRVFVDLLPESWTGRPPGLPQDVVDELALRLRTAEARVRQITQQREAIPPAALKARVATLPTLTRIVFEPPAGTPVRMERDGQAATVIFEAPLTLDIAKLKRDLPAGISAAAKSENGRLFATIAVEGAAPPVAFIEDGTAVIDLGRLPGKASPEAKSPPPPPPRAKPETEKLDAAIKPQAVSTPDAAPARPELRADAQAAAPVTAPAATPAAPPSPAQPVATGHAARTAPAGPIRPRLENGERQTSIRFPFREPTAAAAFLRDRRVTVVFDTAEKMLPLHEDALAGSRVAKAELARLDDGAVLTFDLDRQTLARLLPDGDGWTLMLGEASAPQPLEPLNPVRAKGEAGRAAIAVPIRDIGKVRWIDDALVGDRVAVVTALGPATGVALPQGFVQFRLLPSLQGLAVSAIADDVTVRAEEGRAMIGRAGGLAISGAPVVPASTDAMPPVFARDTFDALRVSDVGARWRELAEAAAKVSPAEKAAARLSLGAFLVANGLAMEGSGVLGTLAADEPDMAAGREVSLWQALDAFLLGRDVEAARALSAPSLAGDGEAALLTAALDARAGRWRAAAAGFLQGGDLLDRYSDMLQTNLRALMAQALIEVRDLPGAAREVKRLQGLATTSEQQMEALLLRARVEDAGGQAKAAIASYAQVASGPSRLRAAEAVWRGVDLGLRSKTMTAEEATASLEALAMTWRGDEAEVQALGRLGAIYTDAGRWRDAFQVSRTANDLYPDHEVSRRLHEATSRRFEDLFLTGKAASIGPVDALALYYDFKEFTPIGRRGDEMIRHLADRMVALDLVEQAGDLLAYQVEYRLSGAAKATVAARLASLRLMAGKPVEALKALQSSRLPDLPRDVTQARLLLHAKALAEQGRTDLAVDILANESGADIDRLKADALWKGKRWRDAGEAYERLTGDNWREKGALDEASRADVMRAAIAYALSEEKLSLDRLRGKYAGKLAQTPDEGGFGFLTGGGAGGSTQLRDMARIAASADTLGAFMADYRKRYPGLAPSARQSGGVSPAAQAPAAATPTSG